jgi:hypothetical protein
VSYFLRVLCRDGQATLTAQQIEGFILDGVFFDAEPEFQVERAHSDDDGWGWRRMTIHYDHLKRPIVIEHDRVAAAPAGELDELREVLQAMAPGISTELRRHLDATNRIVALDVDQAGLTEDAWFMLDCLESFIAKRCDGIVYAPDEGFYDSALKLIAVVPDPA